MALRVKKVAKLRRNLPFSSEIWQILGVEKTGTVKSGGFNCPGNGRAFIALEVLTKPNLKNKNCSAGLFQ
jgi:hypothetical protein